MTHLKLVDISINCKVEDTSSLLNRTGNNIALTSSLNLERLDVQNSTISDDSLSHFITSNLTTLRLLPFSRQDKDFVKGFKLAASHLTNLHINLSIAPALLLLLPVIPSCSSVTHFHFNLNFNTKNHFSSIISAFPPNQLSHLILTLFGVNLLDNLKVLLDGPSLTNLQVVKFIASSTFRISDEVSSECNRRQINIIYEVDM